MLRHNSLLKIKTGICKECQKDGLLYAKGLCQSCYTTKAKLRYASKYSESEDAEDEESVAILKKDCDLLFSRLLRLRAAEPETGMCRCFICERVEHYSLMQAMHYEGRADSIIRYDPRNVRVGDVECNIYRDGNLEEYAKKLNAEDPGLAARLKREGREVYKFTRDELKRMVTDFSKEIAYLKKLKHLK